MYFFDKLGTSLPESSPHEYLQLFEGLSESTIQDILQASIVKSFPADHLLVQQGDFPTHTYVILEGRLRTFRVDETGHEATIRMITKGQTCIDAALFVRGPSPVTVQTTTSCTLLMIPENVLQAYVTNNLKFANNIIKILSRHYKDAMLQIDSINIKPPLRRVGYYFLLRHLEEGSGKLEFDLPFKKLTIANYLGMTPETFSRCLKQLKKMGIDVDGERIKILDPSALCQFCDADSAYLCRGTVKARCPQLQQARHQRPLEKKE